MIRHIVTWKLASADPVEKTQAVDDLVAVFGPLPGLIPEIRSLQLGRDLDETPDNWDFVLVMDFETTADVATYQSHPEHDKARVVVRRVTTERASIDFEF